MPKDTECKGCDREWTESEIILGDGYCFKCIGEGRKPEVKEKAPLDFHQNEA